MLNLRKNKEVSAQIPSGEAKPERSQGDLGDNVDIHVIPERFRGHNTAEGSRKVGMLIFFFGIVLICGLAGGAYYYFINYAKKPVTEKQVENNTATTTAKTTETEPATTTPETTQPEKVVPQEKPLNQYIKFKEALTHITALEDYGIVINNFGSPSLKYEWAQQKLSLEQLSTSIQQEFVSLIKNFRPTRTQLELSMTETMNNQSTAILTMENGTQNIKATLVVDGEKWKVSKEENVYYVDATGSTTTIMDWIESKKNFSANPDDRLKPGADADSDGLTDLEEGMLGTSKEETDSDKDGYTDMQELNNLYNPAGGGKLTDNTAVKELANNTFGYKFLYPSQLVADKVGGDDSIILKAENNHFIQVIVSPNVAREEIEEWYRKNLASNDPVTAEIIERTVPGSSSLNWRGIKNKDGLTIYLTDSAREYIYTITYSTGQNSTLEYVNIFNTIIKTFTIDGAGTPS